MKTPINQSTTLLDDTAIPKLTSKGEQELREPGTKLLPAQLETLILIDGHSSIAQIIKRAPNLAADAMRTSLNELIGKNLVSLASSLDADIIDAGDFFTVDTRTASPAAGEQYQAEADSETEFLQRNGYCVNMARSPTVKRQHTAGIKPTVFIIDDDPDICKVLQMYLKLEDFDSYTAGNREEIVAGLRRQPQPDLVLLDVWLTDVNGFNILNKMRQHPVLKDMPVIMLTAEATRDAVLKGILGGADGYITKPFQIHPLIKAIRTVLGLKQDAKGDGQDWDYSI